MRRFTGAFLLILAMFLTTGCQDKKRVIYIENRSLCQAPIATLYLKDIAVYNNSQTFNLSANEIKLSLAESLTQTNCYKVILADKDPSLLESEDEFVLNTKADIYQEKVTTNENLFKKEQKENITLMLSLSATSGFGKKVVASATSELAIDKAKYFGIEKGVDERGDKELVLKTATKKASIALRDGFSKLGQ